MTLLCLCMLACLPHKFHASITELEVNPETGKIEVVMRLFTDDLESALGKRLGRPVVIDRDDLSGEVLAYARDVFRIEDGKGQLLTLNWVGMEVQVKNTFVYLELDQPAALEGMTLVQRVFCELFNDQVNTVNHKHGDRHGTLIFKSGDKSKALTL